MGWSTFRLSKHPQVVNIQGIEHTVAVQTYWAWQFASQGNAGDSSFWLLVALWGSFVGGIVYNQVRH